MMLFHFSLMDRTTDAGNQEDELIVLSYCSKNATTPCSCYLSIHSPGKADASSLLLCVNEALKYGKRLGQE